MSTEENIINSVMDKHEKAGDLQNLNAQTAAKMFDEIHDAMMKQHCSGNNESTMNSIATAMNRELGERKITNVDVSFSANKDGKLDNNDKLVVTEKGMIYNSVSNFPVLELFDSSKDAPQAKPQPKPEIYTGHPSSAEQGPDGFKRGGDSMPFLQRITPEQKKH